MALDAIPASASSAGGGTSVVPGRTALQLQRLPRRRDRAKNLRPVERAGWVVACELAVDEAEQSLEAKRRGVLALVRKLVAECKRRGRPFVDLSRAQIAEALGFEGAAAPHGSSARANAEEAVRRLLRRAELAGELLTFREAGHKFRSGVPSHKVVVVRLLWRLDALPRPLRLRALEDQHVAIALEALRRATAAEELAAIAREGERAAPLEIVAPAGAGCAGGVLRSQPPSSDGGPGSVASLSHTVSVGKPSSPPSAAPGTAAPAARETRAEGQDPRPAVPGTAPAPDRIEPAGPAQGPEARGTLADAWKGAVMRGRDGEVSLDLERLRTVRTRCEQVLAELRAEELAAEGAATAPLPLRWRTPEVESRGRAELARGRDRDREIDRLTRIIADAKVAARVGWKLHKAAEPRGGEVFTSPHENRVRAATAAAAMVAAEAALADAPPAWAPIFRELERRLRPSAVVAREDVAALRCVADAGDALVFQARDDFHRERVRDLGIGKAIGELARELLGRELQVEVRA